MQKLRELKTHKGIKLTSVASEIDIDAPAEEIWQALLHYGDVANFHAGVEASKPAKNCGPKAALGAVRTCDVRDGRREIKLVERITEFNDGHSYRYEVFEWENFPLKVMFFGFSIVEKDGGKRALRLIQNYRLKPGFMSSLMKWKIRQMQHRILLGYKHYIETGEKNVPIKDLVSASGRAVRSVAPHG